MFEPKRVTLKQMRALAAVAEAGSITAAAARLNVTPPAVSLQLRELEDNAGLPLLERRPDGMAVTQAGRELLVVQRRTEAGLRACRDALAALSGLEGGRVSVGVISTAKYFAPRALAAFIKERPKVDMRLLVANREETIAALESFDLDLAIMGRPPEGPDYERSTIGDHPHVIIAPPEHKFAQRKRLQMKDLAEETFLLREEGSGTRALTQQIFNRSRVHPRIGMEIGSNETIKQAVIAGIGVALISAHTVCAELKEGRLVELPVSGLPVIRKWYVVRRAERTLLPAAQALWDFLGKRGATFLPER